MLLFFFLLSHGDACWQSPNNERRRVIISGGYRTGTGDSDWENILDSNSNTIFGDQYANGWHIIRIIFQENKAPVFYIDNDLIYAGKAPVGPDYLCNPAPLWLGERSSGYAGKAYHNWIKISNVNSQQNAVAKGWLYDRGDLAGSASFSVENTTTSSLPVTNWSFSVPPFVNNIILTGDVAGDEKLEIVTLDSDTLFVLSPDGQLQTKTYVGINNQISYSAILADFNDDSKLEIGVGYNRSWWNFGDMKTRIYSGDGTVLKEFTRPGNYDGFMGPIAKVGSDVIIVYEAGYALSPSGYARWNYETGNCLWQYLVAPMGNGGSIADFNNDGLLELTYNHYTPHNGASVNGTDDSNCCTVITNENGTNILKQQYPIASTDGALADFFIKFTPVSPYKLFSEKAYSSPYPGTSRLHIRSLNGSIINTKTGWNNAAFSYAWGDADKNGVTDIYAANDYSPNSGRYIYHLSISLQV